MYRVKTLLVLATILVLSTSLFAVVEHNSNSGNEILPARGEYQPNPNRDLNTRDTDVTMSWLDAENPNVNFGGWTKDYFLEYYVPAADGYVTSIDFHFSDLPAATGGGMSVWIYEANYPWAEINSEAIANACGDANLGYYDEATGYETVGSNWVQGGINSIDGAVADYNYDPLGVQSWPFLGSGSISIEPNADDEGWLNFNLQDAMGEDFYFLRGVPFVVVIRFNGFPDQGDGSDYRMGFYSANVHMDPQPSMKFYSSISSPNGRCGTNDWGWYIRSYVWDWDVNATLTGDRGPDIVSMDQLVTTLSTDDRVVNANIADDNPSGGSAGVASASLFYTIDGGEAVEVAMSGSEPNFSAVIPGQSPGTEVSYWVEATDVNGLSTVGVPATYNIFLASEPMLLVYDTDEIIGLEWYYMYGIADTFANHYDLWEQKFGPVNAELVANYEIIYHIMGGGPYNDASGYSTVYGDWLAAGTTDAPHRLFISGQDYGTISGFADTTFPADAFENAYLGVETLGPQDANYDGTAASYEGPYAITAVAGDPLTGFLGEFAGDSLQLFYNPAYEVGFNNWIDNMTLSTGTACFTDPNHDDAPAACYNSGDGWKTAFWTLDALSIDYFSPVDTASMYHWALTDVGNPAGPTFDWFAPPLYPVSTDDALNLPSEFKLHASYPNPFNPVTNIAYELGNAADVSITVYNMLGQEVTTLVSGFQAAGNYTVTWNGMDANGHSVPSGLYFYEMQTEGFSATQKMMLLK